MGKDKGKGFFKARSAAAGIPLQVNRLRSRFPTSKISFGRAHLEWIGQLQPTPLSQVYTIKIAYSVGSRPSVKVLSPELVSREGERLPHVFSGDRLCLFKEWYTEWSSSMLIADTIIPWSSMWLTYYEIWLLTGVWSGSKSAHLPVGQTKAASPAK